MSRRFSSKRSAAFASLLLSFALCTTTSAHAEEPSALQLEAARTVFKQGIASRQAGDHKQALTEFREAQVMLRSPVTGLSVAQEMIALGMLLEARQELLAIENIPRSPKDTQASQDARDEARRLTAELKPRLSTLRATVHVSPEGAPFVVRVDDVELPFAALSAGILVNPGAHTIEVISGGASERQSVSLSEGKEGNIDLAVTAPATPPPSASSAIAIAGPPASVSSTSTSPAATKVHPRTSDSLLWIGVLVGGPGLIVGAVTGELALSRAGTLKSNCPRGNCPETESADLSAVKRFSTVSTISFVAAGAGAAVVLVDLLFLGEPPDAASARASSLRIRPEIGLGSFGLKGEF